MLFLTLHVACVTDVKGESCGLGDAMVDADGTTYCPDANAPADCEAAFDTIIEAFVNCADGAFTEEELRNEIDQESTLGDCDYAVATSVTYDDCLDSLSAPECNDDGYAVLPEACTGAVLMSE